MKQNIWEPDSHIVHFIEDGTRRNIFMLMALDSSTAGCKRQAPPPLLPHLHLQVYQGSDEPRPSSWENQLI